MGLRVVGAGLGRTGTHSLKLALERLLGAPCHHMIEVVRDERQFPLWASALDGEPDWSTIYDGYAATVDWPGVGFWRELVAAHPDAVVLLSRRESPRAWWNSARRTIFAQFNGEDVGASLEARATALALFARNGIDPGDADVAMAAYEAHLEAVRSEVRADRLVEWTTGDGWQPLCDALRLPVPDEAFPHVNTTAEFRARREARVAQAGTEGGGP
jgi:hypothetical protein